MKRRSGTCLLALTAALMAQQVSAQAGSSATGAAGTTGSVPATQRGTLAIEILKAGKSDYPQASRTSWAVPISEKSCSEGTLTVLVRNLQGGNTLPYLEAWLGTATNCEQGDRGSRASGTAICSKLNIPNRAEVQVANRVSYEVTIELGPTCDSEGERPIYFLQLPSENSNSTTASYGVLGLRVDKTHPPVPANVMGSTGNTVIPLTWSQNTYDTNAYYVLADWGASTGQGQDFDAGLTDGGISGLEGVNPECPSGVLRKDQPIELSTFPQGVYHQRLEGGGRMSWDFNGNDFHGAKTVPAVVVAEDLAGNLSVMSNVECLHVTQTTGFWKSYQVGAGDSAAADGCACSAPGAPGSQRSTLWGLPLLLVLGWAGARSRTRRRAR